MRSGKNKAPALHTVLSPSLLNLYDLTDSTVVIIDILRATSTIATALYNGAKSVIPVDSVADCIKLGKQMEVIRRVTIWKHTFTIHGRFYKRENPCSHYH